MNVLEEAKNWALNNLIDEDTIAILLVGSWARGVGTDINDIDLIVIKQLQLIAIAHDEHRIDNFTMDIWIHDRDAVKEDIFGVPRDLNQINNTSMILSFLDGAIKWYEKEPFIDLLKAKAEEWFWDPEYLKFLDFPDSPPKTEHLVNAYNENKQLIEAAKERLKSGKPVSHRKKDYPELIEIKTEEKALKVLELTEQAYILAGIDRKWTEFDDGRKAIETGKWGEAVASLKDVLRFIVRYQLPSVPEQLLDPSIWNTVEDMTLSNELINALKEAYS